MKDKVLCTGILILGLLISLSPVAADDKGSKDHPVISRYPGQEIKWYAVENFKDYQIPTGDIVGYRKIEKIINVHGRVTRIFYSYDGTDKTHKEIWINYLDALKNADFDILAQGAPTQRINKNKVGGRNWLSTALLLNLWNNSDPDIGSLLHGTSTQGGSAVIITKKERDAGTVYVLVYIEQDSKDKVGTLVDVIEVGEAQSGLITVDAQAIGEDIGEYGRVVLDGILFEYDQAVLKSESKQALIQIAQYLKSKPEIDFYVVGHTDSKGTYAYNHKLSKDRARAVVAELVKNYDIQSSRLEPHGIGPLEPVFSNKTDNGRMKNRRVELVEK